MEIGMNNNSLYQSRHFRLEQLADGIYAAINTNDGWAIGNAGIIDLGDRTLVYDAFISPEAAMDLRDAAESITGRAVHMLINSHYHNDHIWGNQAFSAETDILSSTKTRELITTEGSKEVQEYRKIARERLETLETQFANTRDKTTLNLLKLNIAYFQAINATLPILHIRLPNLTFTGNMTFNGSRRSARLITYEGGHCGSDTILYLPDDGIVFMEDLLFSGFHPYLAEGNPYEIQRILAEVRKLQAKTFVPGHGPVGGASHLDWMVGYIDNLNSLVGEVIKNGGTESELDKITMPGEYQNLIFPNIFKDNLKLLYQRQLISGSGFV
jgi:glyoxylase-like metal-dependent hydrolase (beta-lactamase superfamily II)